MQSDILSSVFLQKGVGCMLSLNQQPQHQTPKMFSTIFNALQPHNTQNSQNPFQELD